MNESPAVYGKDGPGRAKTRGQGGSGRTATMLLATAAAIALLWGISQFPVPYVAEAPGPTLDTLGQQNGKDLITVADAKTYPASGKLLATTVSLYGGPGNDVSLLKLISLWLDGDDIIPEHLVFSQDTTKTERDNESAAEQTSSQEAATVAALTEIGTPVPATLTVSGAVKDGPADGTIKKGDVLTSINGVNLVTYQDLVTQMASVKPGQQVTAGFTRGGKAMTATITAADGGDGNAILGLALNPSYRVPIKVDFNIEGVGGPSAGMMYALGIIDKLTPGNLTGGKVISGTGTVDAAGRVGPIGGAGQKIRGAARDGAAYFLIPQANCASLGGKDPDGIQVIPVTTLDGAYKVVQHIAAGDVKALASCPATPGAHAEEG